MTDYKKMYFTLFNKITYIITQLQMVQQKVKKMYMASDEEISQLMMLSSNNSDGSKAKDD